MLQRTNWYEPALKNESGVRIGKYRVRHVGVGPIAYVVSAAIVIG